MEEKREYLGVEDLTSYKIASELSDLVWNIVIKWEWLAKSTVGAQFIRSTDSIAANIAEGFGRYHKKDKIKFYFNARGSLFEAEHWCKKAFKRDLLTETESEHILEKVGKLPREINTLIKLTSNLKT